MLHYIIDNTKNYSEGGSAQFYCLKNYKDLGFKEFSSKKYAIDAYNTQKRLSQFNLAPKIYGKVRRLKISWYCATGWGFITEKAILVDDHIMSKKLKQIQNLVDEIYEKTGWKFWDCHYYNIGYVKRGSREKLVCIDTGKESFSCISNAWANPDPGPKCSYCLKYNCKCEESNAIYN